jgi:hypothetical protein
MPPGKIPKWSGGCPRPRRRSWVATAGEAQSETRTVTLRLPTVPSHGAIQVICSHRRPPLLAAAQQLLKARQGAVRPHRPVSVSTSRSMPCPGVPIAHSRSICPEGRGVDES